MTRTLSGFDSTPKNAKGWQLYIDELMARRRDVVTRFHSIEKPTTRQRIKAASRYDVLSEFIARAEAELRA